MGINKSYSFDTTNFFKEFNKVKENVFNTGISDTKKFAEPYIGGYSFIHIYYRPLTLIKELSDSENNSSNNAADSDFNDFFDLMELTFKEFQNLPSIELQTTGIQGGFTQNEHHYPTEIGKNMTDVSMKFQEYSGVPFQRMFQKWITAIRDPETGLYRLSKYGLKHYSISLLYVNTSPAIGSSVAQTRSESVEFACILTSMFPKKIDLDKFNYSQGDHSIGEVEQTFTCNLHWGKKIMDRAQEFVASDYFWKKIDKAYNNIYDNFAGDNEAYNAGEVSFNNLSDKDDHTANDLTGYQNKNKK